MRRAECGVQGVAGERRRAGGVLPADACAGCNRMRVAVRVGRFEPVETRGLQHRAHQSRVHAHGVHVTVRAGFARVGETVHRRAQELRGHRHANLDGESHGQAAGVRTGTRGALPMGKVGGVRRGGDQQRERAPRPQGRVHHASVRNHRWRRADVDAAGQSTSEGVGRVGHGDSVMNMNARTRIRY